MSALHRTVPYSSLKAHLSTSRGFRSDSWTWRGYGDNQSGPTLPTGWVPACPSTFAGQIPDKAQDLVVAHQLHRQTSHLQDRRNGRPKGRLSHSGPYSRDTRMTPRRRAMPIFALSCSSWALVDWSRLLAGDILVGASGRSGCLAERLWCFPNDLPTAFRL